MASATPWRFSRDRQLPRSGSALGRERRVAGAVDYYCAFGLLNCAPIDAVQRLGGLPSFGLSLHHQSFTVVLMHMPPGVPWPGISGCRPPRSPDTAHGPLGKSST